MKKMDFKVEIEKKKESPKKGGITSMRSAIVAELVSFMGEDEPLTQDEKEEVTRMRTSKRIKYWLGRTRHIEPSRIIELMRQTKEARNPRALMNWLISSEAKKTKKIPTPPKRQDV
ncbi:MAG: hypothetical protein V1652_01340 [bacterium]